MAATTTSIATSTAASTATAPPPAAAGAPAGRAGCRRGPGLLTAVRIEIAKMRRLRTLPVTLALVGASVAMCSSALFPSSARAGFTDPAALPWAGLLLNAAFTNAMIGPVMVAVLASRQTEIEHSGAGWNLAASAGLTPGALCRVKVAALGLVIIPAVLVQSAALVLLGRAVGITVPLDAGQWAVYTLMLIGVDLAMCALHVWLAAVVDNQLIGMGAGLLGGFVASFMLLAPPWLARLLPWGYYAVITNARFVQDGEDSGVVYSPAPVGWVMGFLALASLAFAIATRRLDRIER
ncbi:ABC transporter permease [Actinomyces bowdenii]|uniref:ABC transporter permease n=1 Tax=Actinomyces bowdenii TaxID=131109 RepID=UPI00214ACFCE|nr:ABC transporter permease [Actinomyces bowdenii]MCR2052165.1 ABC transporter permease [Actinomyces bowdenii]